MCSSLENIECVRCGSCCPKDCRFLQWTVEGLAGCQIHPLITGLDWHVLGCNLTPAQLYSVGIACAAVVDYLANHGQPETRERVAILTGQVVYVGSSLHQRFAFLNEVEMDGT